MIGFGSSGSTAVLEDGTRVVNDVNVSTTIDAPEEATPHRQRPFATVTLTSSPRFHVLEDRTKPVDR